MTTTPDAPERTVDEALARFELIGQSAGREDEGKACAMTALSWIAGEAWSDHPACAHRLLADLTIRANDADATTPEQRAEIVRAGESGIIDTWWVPTEVVVWAVSEGNKTGDDPVARALAAIEAVAAWKAGPKGRPDLTGADLTGANLARAYLAGADLADAYLADAYLVDANLAGAYLAGANLAGANLTGANLADANLTDADLAGAYLADARGNRWTVLPAGWRVDEATGLVVRHEEVSA